MAHVELRDIVTDADREAVLALQRAPGLDLPRAATSSEEVR